MEADDIRVLQISSERNYEDAPTGSPNEAAWMQNRLLAEIAIQLAELNQSLKNIGDMMNVMK